MGWVKKRTQKVNDRIWTQLKKQGRGKELLKYHGLQLANGGESKT